MKKDIKELFKNRDDISFNHIDFSSEEIKKVAVELVKRQEAIIKSSVVSVETMRKITFDI